MRPLDPAQRIRRWHTYLVVWRMHRALGLVAAALLLLLSVSGSILVIHHDVERWLGPPYRLPASPTSHATAMPPTLRDLVAAAAPFAPDGYRAFRLMPGQANDEPPKILFTHPATATRWAAFVDPRDASVLWHGPDQALFTPWLLHLHMHLHAGRWGYVVTGFAGLGLVMLGLTGLFLHRHELAGLVRRKPMRLDRGWRVFLHDAHTWIGAVSIYFSLVLGATGLAYVLLIAPAQFQDRPEPPPPFDLAQLAPIEPMIAAAHAALPGQELLRVAFPTGAGAPVRLLLLDRAAPVWAKFSSVDFEPTTGDLLRSRSGRDATTAEKWRASVAPLHFGFYGATWVKVAYVIGGLAPGLLALTGIALWARKRWRLRHPTRVAPAGGAGNSSPRLQPASPTRRGR